MEGVDDRGLGLRLDGWTCSKGRAHGGEGVGKGEEGDWDFL